MDTLPSELFARCVAASKRVRWDIEADVIRDRRFDPAHKFLPETLTLAGAVRFLSPAEKRYFSQVQGRTYANMFGLVERFIAAKVTELTRDHWFGDQVAFEALVRFTDEELKHQELFRRTESLIGEAMPAGYSFPWEPNAVAGAVLSKSSWAVLALTLHIELFSQLHYRESIREDNELSPLVRDIFRLHWVEESQHALLDELEWRRVDAGLDTEARDRAVDDFIDLLGALDGIIAAQADGDGAYFIQTCGRRLTSSEEGILRQTMLDAYRRQYIASGIRHPHFLAVLSSLTDQPQLARILRAAGVAPGAVRQAA